MKVMLRIHSRLKARIVGRVREATIATFERAAPHAVEALSRVADAKLESTAALYKEGLRDAVSITTKGLKIELSGITKDLEVGFPARDMKPGLLKSPGAKQGKNGRYVDIPFRHKLSGMPMGVKTAVQAKVRAERAQAKQEGRAERSPMRVTGRMAGGTNAQQRIQFLKTSRGNALATSNMLHLVKHKTSIHSNMMRTKQGTSGRYSTIRRISANSDAQAWWHPGFKGIQALKQVEPELKQMMKQTFKQELARRGAKTK